MTNGQIGQWGQDVARRLWPTLRFMPPQSSEDFKGADAYDGRVPGQIKADLHAATTGRFVWEFVKCNGAWNEYGSVEGWRPSPVHPWTGFYIFVTLGAAFRIPYPLLVTRFALGRPMKSINDTAIGIWVPTRQLEVLCDEGRAERKPHPFTPVAVVPRCPHCGREVAGASGTSPVVCVLCSGALNGWRVQT
jgi:hypothetical protein